MNPTSPNALESLLRQDTVALDQPFARTRARFAARAVREGHAVVVYEDHDEVLDELARVVSPRILHAGRADLTSARRELDEYFAGDRHEFDVDLDWSLARRFRKGVLQATALIPYGRTSTYRGGSEAKGQLLALEHAL